MIDLDYAPTAQILPKARDAADRALALDDSMAEAHTARGLVAHELEWDQPRAEKEFKRAMVNDPLNTMYLMDLAANSYKRRRYDDALTDLERLRKVAADYPFAGLMAGAVHAAQADWADAIADFGSTRAALGPLPFVLGFTGQAQALAGDRAAAQATLTELTKASQTGYAPAFCFAVIYYALGDRNQGLAQLQRAFQDRNAALVWLKHSPAFDNVSEDPRAKALLDRAGQ